MAVFRRLFCGCVLKTCNVVATGLPRYWMHVGNLPLARGMQSVWHIDGS